MIKLILTDMDGTFLNSQGDFNRELFKQVKQMMEEKGVVFAPCTGKQSERVEEIFRGGIIAGDGLVVIGRCHYAALTLRSRFSSRLINQTANSTGNIVPW